jgi:hypothetical protein
VSRQRLTPPWDFFHDASVASLESYELSRLNSSANLRRQITALLDQWVEDNSHALLAHWVRHERQHLPRAVSTTSEADSGPQTVLPFDRPAQAELVPHRQDRVPKLARGHH